jgi:hypothetical protein
MAGRAGKTGGAGTGGRVFPMDVHIARWTSRHKLSSGSFLFVDDLRYEI